MCFYYFLRFGKGECNEVRMKKMLVTIMFAVSAFVSLNTASAANSQSGDGCASAACPSGTTCRPDGDTYECVSNGASGVRAIIKNKANIVGRTVVGDGCASAACPSGTTCRPDGDSYECVSNGVRAIQLNSARKSR